MKSTFWKVPILTLLILTSFTAAQGQVVYQPTDTLFIILKVDTDQIPASGNFDYNDYCEFVGQQEDSVENHLTELDRARPVAWKGISTSNQEHEVKIERVKHRIGKRTLRPLKGRGRYDGKYRARVKKKEKHLGREEKYEIKFKVIKNGSENDYIIRYRMDPKLRVQR